MLSVVAVLPLTNVNKTTTGLVHGVIRFYDYAACVDVIVVLIYTACRGSSISINHHSCHENPNEWHASYLHYTSGHDQTGFQA